MPECVLHTSENGKTVKYSHLVEHSFVNMNRICIFKLCLKVTKTTVMLPGGQTLELCEVVLRIAVHSLLLFRCTIICA